MRKYRQYFDGILHEKNDSNLLNLATKYFGSPNKIESLPLKRAIKNGENVKLTFKEKFDNTFVHDACALANTHGGEIILGITKSGNLTGLTHKSIREEVEKSINTIEPKISFKIITPEKEVITVAVTEGEKKPYQCADGFFIREGTETVKLSHKEFMSFIQKENILKYDELKNERAVFEKDFDEKKFENFRNEAKLDKNVNDIDYLYRLGCITSDHELTNAGVLLFAKSNENLIPHATITCVLYKGTIKNKVLERKDLKQDIINDFRECMLFLTKNLKNEYLIDSVKREENLEIPEPALREAIVNAICHRDYFEHGANIMVEIFDNRIDIVSPGGLPPGVTKDNFGEISKRRNEVIARMLTRINLMEKLGTGIGQTLGSQPFRFRKSLLWCLFPVLILRFRKSYRSIRKALR